MLGHFALVELLYVFLDYFESSVNALQPFCFGFSQVLHVAVEMLRHISVELFPLPENKLEEVFFFLIGDADDSSGWLSADWALVYSLQPCHDAVVVEVVPAGAVKSDSRVFY